MNEIKKLGDMATLYDKEVYYFVDFEKEDKSFYSKNDFE